jgi:hypothetical protein
MFNNWIDLRTYLTDAASGITTGLVVAGLVWLFGHKWFSKELSKIKWQKAGNVWWLACDLYAVTGSARRGQRDKMLGAIDQALHHARSIEMDSEMTSRLEKLKQKYSGDTPITEGAVEKEINDLISYGGKLAEAAQPGYKPRPA